MLRRPTIVELARRFAAQVRADVAATGRADTEAAMATFAGFASALRPGLLGGAAAPAKRLSALTLALSSDATLRDELRDALAAFLCGKRAVSLFSDAGMFPNRGFIAEMARRVSHALLPELPNHEALQGTLEKVWHGPADARWIAALPLDVVVLVLVALDATGAGAASFARLRDDLLESLRVLSYRLVAIGLEPELLRIEPELDRPGSPFVTQNRAVLHLLEELGGSVRDARRAEVERVIRAELAECLVWQERLRARAAREGTSLSLTLLLERVQQHVERMELVLDVAVKLAPADASRALAEAVARLSVHVVADNCRSNEVREYWTHSIQLLALRVTANAGRTGEHYITSTSRELVTMFGSAALAGFVIAFMALVKLQLLKAHLPPLTEVLANCLNYGLGFVAIHLMHGTVATKQPAMTAATIAASIGEGGRLDRLAELIARVVRSQLVAVAGNVLVAVPLSVLIAWGMGRWLGSPYPAPEKAVKLIDSLHPFASGALIFAAFAGVCLFSAGLVSGFYDNIAAYNRIPERVAALRVVRRLLGAKGAAALARYIERNLGALAGNFSFGFMLGGVAAVGLLFGLPIDVRHVTLSAAYVGYAATALDFALEPRVWLGTVAGVALIGVVNLGVSFSLSLWIAARARRVSILRTGELLIAMTRLFFRSPRSFFLPPRAEVEPTKIAAADTDTR